MKRFNRKRIVLSSTLFILVILLLFFIDMDIFTLSRYENTVSASNNISTAIYLVDDSYQVVNVMLPDVIPDNRQYTYSFSVSNYTATRHSDTSVKYRIHIRTTTNTEIEYELFNTLDIEEAESCISSNEIVQDYYDTHFRHIYTDYYIMPYDEDITDDFTILFTFSDDFQDAKYSGIAELIEITVESSQILDSDTP